MKSRTSWICGSLEKLRERLKAATSKRTREAVLESAAIGKAREARSRQRA